jgi:hypothetical protein
VPPSPWPMRQEPSRRLVGRLPGGSGGRHPLVAVAETHELDPDRTRDQHRRRLGSHAVEIAAVVRMVALPLVTPPIFKVLAHMRQATIPRTVGMEVLDRIEELRTFRVTTAPHSTSPLLTLHTRKPAWEKICEGFWAMRHRSPPRPAGAGDRWHSAGSPRPPASSAPLGRGSSGSRSVWLRPRREGCEGCAWRSSRCGRRM